MQEARVLFYRNLGFRNEISFEGSVGQIIADAAIQYKSQSFLGDELTIDIGVGEFTKYGFDMFYRLTNKATGQGSSAGKNRDSLFRLFKRKSSQLYPLALLTKLQ